MTEARQRRGQALAHGHRAKQPQRAGLRAWASARCLAWQHWWQARSHRQQHWMIGAALGLVIEIAVHLAGHSWHLAPVVSVQNWGLDVMTRLNQTLCALTDPDIDRRGVVNRLLRCPGSDLALRPPLLVEVTEEDWRNPAWGGGEPVQAPRLALAELVDRVFELGAQLVVLDVLIEDPASAGDEAFAEQLRAMEKRWFASGRKLVLVRSERAPLAGDADAFLPEMRQSSAIDPVVAEVVAKWRGSVILAAPYFRRSPDLVTRDWELFRAACQRLPNAPGQGRIAVLPSVQLAVHALLAAGAQGSPTPVDALLRFEPLQIKGQVNGQVSGQTPAPSPTPGSDGVAALASQEEVACVPMPALGPATQRGPALDIQACSLAQTLDGPAAALATPTCQKALALCAATASNGAARPVACQTLNTTAAANGPTQPPNAARQQGLKARYWEGIRQAITVTPRLDPLPGPHDLGKRIVFRLPPDSADRLSIRHLGDAGTPSPLDKQFRDRTVVIGQSHELSGDVFGTPMGTMAGAWLLVNAIDSMAEQGLISPPRPWVTVPLALLLIVVVAYCFARWTSVMGAILAAVAIFVLSVPLSALLFAYGVWLDFVAPVIGILIHSLWAGSLERRELKRWRAEISTTGH